MYGHGNNVSEGNLTNSQKKLRKISDQEFNSSPNVFKKNLNTSEVNMLSSSSKLKKFDSQEVNNYSSPKNNFISNNDNQFYDDNVTCKCPPNHLI